MRTCIKSWSSSILAQFRLLPVLEGTINLGRCCPDNSVSIFDQIFTGLADIEDSHNILDVFDFKPDQTIH